MPPPQTVLSPEGSPQPNHMCPLLGGGVCAPLSNDAPQCGRSVSRSVRSRGKGGGLRSWGGGLLSLEGAFSHSTNYYVVHPRNTPENHPPAEASMQNRIGGAELRPLGPVATGGGKQPTFGTAHSAPPECAALPILPKPGQLGHEGGRGREAWHRAGHTPLS